MNQSNVQSSKFKLQTSVSNAKTNQTDKDDQTTDDSDNNPDSNNIYEANKTVHSAPQKHINRNNSKSNNHREQIYSNEPNIKPPSAIYHEIGNFILKRLMTEHFLLKMKIETVYLIIFKREIKLFLTFFVFIILN